MKATKKIISVVLVITMLFSVFSFSAFAGGDEIILELDTQYQVWVGEDVEIYRFTPEEDGWYEFYTEGDWDTYATLYNSNWDEILYADDTYKDNNFQLTCKLYQGYTYYLEVGAYVEDLQLANFDLYVTETVGVEEVVITKAPDNIECIIGLEYDSIDLRGMEVTFTLSDGEEVLWSYNKGNTVAGQYVYDTIDSDGYGNYFVEIVCGEGYDRMFFEMVENPVESISVYSMDPIEIYELSSGYYYEGVYHYNYRIPDDTQMQINYKDGTNTVVDYYFDSDNGFFFDVRDEQDVSPFSVGDNNIYISYMGCTTTATVTILPCPFESVTLLSAPSRQYIYGDSGTGYVYDGNYVLMPHDLTGLSFELGYSDGTKEVIDSDDIDMDLKQIDGYMYEIGEYLVTGAGNVQVTLSYKGMDITYSVTVVETPVDSINVTKAPDKYEYEDVYYADYTGMEIKVDFKDGTSETITATKDNMYYVLNGILHCYVSALNFDVCLVREFDINTEEYYTVVSCLGAVEFYDGIKYTQTRDIEGITRVEDFSYNTDGMTVYVEYADGTEETLTYSPVDYYDYGDNVYEGFAMTENGITYFETALSSKNETSTTYRLYTLLNDVDVTVENLKIGDVDGDGKITVLDATAVQRHVAQLVLLSENELLAADVDKDSDVNVLDATFIQRFVAQIITEF